MSVTWTLLSQGEIPFHCTVPARQRVYKKSTKKFFVSFILDRKNETKNF